MKTILVTGSNGQLGRALRASYAGSTDFELYETDVAEGEGIKSLDITDVDAVLEAVRAVKPYAIVNCAAYTAVDKQEEDRDRSYIINAIGPRNLSIASAECGSKLIHISTDYVFDGKGSRPYIEFDKPNPQSAYGTTKLAGEEFVKAFASRYFILRTAWLYGDGSNFVKTMLRLSGSHDEISVVDDQHGSPTSAAELARAVMYLLPSDNYGLFHATCEGDTNWAAFAEEIFRLSGRETRVRHVSTSEYTKMNPQSAPRPENSILDNYMFRLTGNHSFIHWKDAIREYLEK